MSARDDGDTQVVSGHPEPQEGFGCPGCGLPLALEDDGFLGHLVGRGTTACCGYWPNKDELGRWVRAAQLIRER